MKTRSAIAIILISVAALLSVSCKKGTFNFRGRPGDAIRFSVRSGAGATKTVYNNNGGNYFIVETTDGDETIRTKYEGIDWVEGDRMTVAYIYADPSLGVDLADYYIAEAEASSLSGSKVSSKGTLRSVKPNGLQWHDGDVHQFYASYPALDENYPDYDSFVFEVENGAIHADVPYFYPMTLSSSNSNDMTKDGRVWMENMKYAYMNTMNGDPSATEKGGTVAMTVGAHFTAFEFEVRAHENDIIPLKSFTLSCSRPDEDDKGDDLIGGTFFLMAKYNEDEHGNRKLCWDNVPLAGEGKTSNAITLDFSGETEYEGGGVVLTKDAPVKFTVFVRGGCWLSYLTVGFDIIKDGVRVNRSLKLTGNYNVTDEIPESNLPWIGFASNCKHRIYGLQIPLNVSKLSLWYEGTPYAGEYINDDWND